eukprot:NODE_533_length_7074_cov_0.525878.p3 type:complete len:187 gc:universal NODE_533_length_7074_cov_0.525878:3387-3947(+)
MFLLLTTVSFSLLVLDDGIADIPDSISSLLALLSIASKPTVSPGFLDELFNALLEVSTDGPLVSFSVVSGISGPASTSNTRGSLYCSFVYLSIGMLWNVNLTCTLLESYTTVPLTALSMIMLLNSLCTPILLLSLISILAFKSALLQIRSCCRLKKGESVFLKTSDFVATLSLINKVQYGSYVSDK